jgi:hypothetical protein
MQCSFSREVWFRCGQQLGINFIVPDTTDNLKDWWIAERERFRKKEKGWFDGLVCMVGYAIWKDRNAWIVGNTRLQHSTLNLSTLILEQCRLLRSALGVGIAEAERE